MAVTDDDPTLKEDPMYRPTVRKKSETLLDRLFILVPGLMTLAMGVVLLHG